MTTDIEQRLREPLAAEIARQVAGAACEDGAYFSMANAIAEIERVLDGRLIEAADALAQLRKERDALVENLDNYKRRTRDAETRTVDAEAELALVREALEREREECALVALKERCVRGTDWDLACTTIADKIRARSLQPGGKE